MSDLVERLTQRWPDDPRPTSLVTSPPCTCGARHAVTADLDELLVAQVRAAVVAIECRARRGWYCGGAACG